MSTVNPLASSYACILARSVGSCTSGTLALTQFLLVSGFMGSGVSSLEQFYLFVCVLEIKVRIRVGVRNSYCPGD